MNTPVQSTVQEELNNRNPWYTGDQSEWANRPGIRDIYAGRERFFQRCLDRTHDHFRCHLHVLDAGCGDGYWLTRLGHPHHTQWEAFDYNPVRVRRARQASPDIEVTESCFADYHPRHLFHVVLCSQVLEHIPDDISALKAIRSWLHPEGTLILGVPNEGSLLHRWKRHRMGERFVTDHIHFYTESGIRVLLLRAGFKTHHVMREVLYTGIERLQDFLIRQRLGFALLSGLSRIIPSECSDFYMECTTR